MMTDEQIEAAWEADECPGQTGRELTSTMRAFARAIERAALAAPVAQAEPTRTELIQAQIRFSPDSRILDVGQALLWMNEDDRVARSLALCLQHPIVVFYECGKRGDGTYAWRGARYGVNGNEYISGFGRY